MKTSKLRQVLHNYINTADDEKIKALYTVLETEINYNLGYQKEEESIEDKELDDIAKRFGLTKI